MPAISSAPNHTNIWLSISLKFLQHRPSLNYNISLRIITLPSANYTLPPQTITGIIMIASDRRVNKRWCHYYFSNSFYIAVIRTGKFNLRDFSFRIFCLFVLKTSHFIQGQDEVGLDGLGWTRKRNTGWEILCHFSK